MVSPDRSKVGSSETLCLVVAVIEAITATLENRRHQMFIAMNRFKVIRGCEAAFEQVWLSRDSHLDQVRGFVEFRLLKGPEADDHTLYASHTVWRSRADFEAWTKSEAFRATHQSAGDNKPLYLGHPQFEGFETIQMLSRGKSADA
jgi:heme-degrading monooxygenase HmoA